MRLIRLLLATAAVAAPAIARADQCAIVDPTVATRAADLAKKSDAVIEYCEPCGDKLPPFARQLTSAEAKSKVVWINGKPVDLAYVFIHTTGDEYQNLGLAAGCTAHGVSKTIKSTAKPMPPPSPMPAPPPPPGSPNRPPPPARIKSIDDLAGTWKVSVRARVSTCGPVTSTSRRNASWTIAVHDGDLIVTTDDGHELGAASVPLDPFGYFKAELVDRKKPQSGSLSFSAGIMNSFFGQMVLMETIKGQRCATSYEVWGSSRTAP